MLSLRPNLGLHDNIETGLHDNITRMEKANHFRKRFGLHDNISRRLPICTPSQRG
jgi:hypothetical protein